MVKKIIILLIAIIVVALFKEELTNVVRSIAKIFI